MGEGISWLRSGRVKRLMEDECYRIVAMKQLRKSMDPKTVTCDHVPDIVSFKILIFKFNVLYVSMFSNNSDPFLYLVTYFFLISIKISPVH